LGGGLVEVGENECQGAFEFKGEGREGGSDDEESSGAEEKESDQ